MDNNVKLLCDRMKIVFIVLGVLFVISILGITAFGIQMKNIGEMDRMNSELSNQQTNIKKQSCEFTNK